MPVLIGYLPADFEHAKKPKGDPWKSKNFLLRGVNERGLRFEWVRSLLNSVRRAPLRSQSRKLKNAGAGAKF